MSDIDKIQITDESSLHDYRTEIPNIVYDLGLSGNQFKLYSLYKRVAGDKGKCWMSHKTLCEKAGMSKKTVIEETKKLTEPRKELNNKSLITIKKRFKEDGGKDTSYITINDIWPINMTHCSEDRGGWCKNYTRGVVENLHYPGVKFTHKEEHLKKIHKEQQQTEKKDRPSASVVVVSSGGEKIKEALAPFKANASHVKIAKEMSSEEIKNAVAGAAQFIHNEKALGKNTSDLAILRRALEGRWNPNEMQRSAPRGKTEQEIQEQKSKEEKRGRRLECIWACDTMFGKYRKKIKFTYSDILGSCMFNEKIITLDFSLETCKEDLVQFIKQNIKECENGKK